MDKKTNRNILGTMLSVSGIVILGKLLGFVKQMVTANAFGATIQTDIISLSEGLVVNIDYLLIQALATAFIPTYIFAKSENPDNCKRFVSNTIKVFLLLTVSIALLFIIGAPIISRILAPSYDSDLSRTLSNYIRIFSPVLIIIVEMAIFNALLKANESFIPGELIGFNQSVILIILVLLIGKKIGPDTLVIGFYAYGIFNLLFLMIHSRKLWRIQKGNPFIDEHVKKLIVMMGPLLLGYSMVFINQQVDKIIVSGLDEGTVTAMSYAAVLSNFICTFIGSISGILFTYITQNIAEGYDDKAANLTTKSVVQMITLLLPISVLTVFNSSDIVKIVFGRGRFDATAVAICSLALIGYGLMFVPYVLREMFCRVQYAYGDSKRPMINSSIAIVFNIVFSIILSRFMGVLGVTLATSISVIICAILNIRSSCHRNSYIKIKDYFKYLPQWILGIIICIVVTYVGRALLSGSATIIRFIVIAIVAGLIYLIITYPILKPLVKRMLRRKS